MRQSFVQNNSTKCPLRHRVKFDSFLEQSQFETQNFCNCSRCLHKRSTFRTVQTSQKEIKSLFAWKNLTLEQMVFIHPSIRSTLIELHFLHLEFLSWFIWKRHKRIYQFPLKIFRQLVVLIVQPHDPWMDLLLFTFSQSTTIIFKPESRDDPPVIAICQLVHNADAFIREHKFNIASDWINVTVIFWIPCENHFSNVIDPLVFLGLRIFPTSRRIFWSNGQECLERLLIRKLLEFVSTVFPYIQYLSLIFWKN